MNNNRKYKVITLCGSIKYKDIFLKVQENLTLKGNIVFMPNFFTNIKKEEIRLDTKKMLDEMHKQKIDMSDEIYVINLNGYIGERCFENLKFKTFNYELDEPRSDDIKEIATAKVKQAYEIVKRPCIALDTDFRIDELNGFPRAFVNFSLETIGVQGILKLMENKKNRKCAFNECLAYHDGKEIHYFYGKHPRKFII